MLPRATDLTLDDLLVLIQPGNPIGQKNKALALSVLANWLADGNMGPIKTSEINVGTSIWKNVANVGPTIEHLYYLGAGIIDAAMKFKVGGSEWVPGNNQPAISGLYSLKAGNVDAANVSANTIKARSNNNRVEVEAMLVKSLAQAAEKLNLGPTQVNGEQKVTGNLDAFGGLTLTNHIWNASAADIVDKMNSLGNGQVAIIFNSSSSDVSFPATTGSPNPRSFSVPHGASVLIVKSGDRIYPAGGILA
jgi:hypothetical protein